MEKKVLSAKLMQLRNLKTKTVLRFEIVMNERWNKLHGSKRNFPPPVYSPDFDYVARVTH